MNRLARLALCLACAAFLVLAGGCSDPDGGSLPGIDAGRDRDSGGARDAGTVIDDDAGSVIDVDAGRTDAGGGGCGVGQHSCGAGCVDDLPDDPTRGCRFGCGEACPAPEHAMGSCTASGACDFVCTAPFTRTGDICTCAPASCTDRMATCGMIDDGCGMMRSCGTCMGGATCIMGSCGCTADAAEGNETSATARVVGMLTDSPDSSLTLDVYNIDRMADQDWFAIDVADNCCDANPLMRVTLDRIPPGANYDLAAFYVCTSGGDFSTCNAGAPDMTVGSGCTSASGGITSETVEIASECTGIDEGGRLLIRVTATTWPLACAAYRLQIDVT